LEAYEFIHTFGDVHIYNDHFDQVAIQLSREPRALPTLRFAREVSAIEDFEYEDFILEGYDPYPLIKGKVSV
jgi:thymidylate synthase